MAAWMLHGLCFGEEAGARKLVFFRVKWLQPTMKGTSSVRRLRLGSFHARIVPPMCFATSGCVRSSMRFLNLWLQIAVWSVECEESNEKWEVWSVKCGVWSVKCGLGRVQCEVRSVECEVWSVQCGVWRVQWEVWRAKWSFKCDMWKRTPVSQSARTHGLGWRTAHASSIDEKGLIYIFKATSAPPRAGTTGINGIIYEPAKIS